MSNPWHPDESQLLAYADRELAADETPAVEQHLAICQECRDRAAAIHEALDRYDRRHAAVRGSLPSPPQPWADLRVRLSELDAGRVQNRRRLLPGMNFRWVAAAAAIVIGALILRLTIDQPLSAAELLHRASVQEKKSNAPKRIRIKTKKSQWVRPAVVKQPADNDAALASLFRQANFDWDEPLSPSTYSQWRDGLASKVDQVRVVGEYYRITTATPAGLLAEASITIRTKDLRAVGETFQFRNDEFVEVSEEVDAVRSIPEEQLAQSRPEPAQREAPRALAPADELKVVAALHSVGADLGDPVEITRNAEAGRIEVSALVMDPERQQQIRTALAGLSFVELRFEQPEDVRPAESAERSPTESSHPPNAVQERLSAKLGSRGTLENFTNHLMDLSEAALARAHALRSLAQRFPTAAERELSPQDLRVLQGIQADHTRQLTAAARQLHDVLRPLAPGGPAATAEGFETWQAGAEDVLATAQRLDRAITSTLAANAPASDADQALTNLLRAASELQMRASSLHTRVAKSGGR